MNYLASFALVKIKIARFFMFLTAMLMLKICFGQSVFSINAKFDCKTTIHSSNTNQNILLNIANAEFDEDETEEINTKEIFIELHYLCVFINEINSFGSYLFSKQTTYSYPLTLSIFKAINCFRI